MKIPNPGRNFRISNKELTNALKKFPLDVVKGNILFYLSEIPFEDNGDKSRRKFVKKCFENNVSPIIIKCNYKDNYFEGTEIRHFSSNYLSKMGTEGLLSKKGAYGIEFTFNNQNPKKEFDTFKGNYLDKMLKDYDIEMFDFIFKETFLKGYKSVMKLYCKRDEKNFYELSLLMGKWFREESIQKLNIWSKEYFSKEFTY
jgi:hypothetical protein